METKADAAIDTEQALDDYRIAVRSRQVSVIGRREVLSGKAKFGIFGDGKEVAQVALARAVQPGDWRAGYYRDQTFMFALGLLSVQEYFAQLYAHGSPSADPNSGGRQMNAHFATHTIDENGDWLNLMEKPNTSADLSPTGAQMPRLVGLGYASRLYRELDELRHMTDFSDNGNEVAFGMIGNASTAEGLFWEAVNAIGVTGSPVVLAIWDDDYGISVPNKYQITKSNLSEVLKGFQREEGSTEGFDLYTVRGWDYAALVDTFQQATATTRREHVPAIVHVIEVTQPQGHSTSGSHERYKSDERLAWEEEYDCIAQMRRWMLEEGIASEEELDAIEQEAREYVETKREAAWEAFTGPMADERDELVALLEPLEKEAAAGDRVAQIRKKLAAARRPLRKDVMSAARRALFATRGEHTPAHERLADWKEHYAGENRERYSAHLYAETDKSVRSVPAVAPIYADDAPEVPGFELLNANFDALLKHDPRIIAFGEDVGHLGGVNQTMAGLQDKYGELRVSDTGIREATIIGQAIGMAQRGLRPIAEIQYLDYLLYAMQILSDDLATLRWRTVGRQKAPVIVRTRGHRLEGVWHSGSLMGGVLNLLHGIYVLVPRNMTQAAGFYNTLLQGDEPGLVVEVLNGYRLREKLPQNLAAFTVPVGVPEIVRAGNDVTVVTYGALVRIALEAADILAEAGVDIELIDVRSLIPFDTNGMIAESLKKTNRVLFLDEDVPGGASATMMRHVLDRDGGFWHLDSEPRCLSAQPHRPPYGSDGNYFSKPSTEDIVEEVYDLMNEFNPRQFPAI